MGLLGSMTVVTGSNRTHNLNYLGPDLINIPRRELQTCCID